jgi:hypothetical protein
MHGRDPRWLPRSQRPPARVYVAPYPGMCTLPGRRLRSERTQSTFFVPPTPFGSRIWFRFVTAACYSRLSPFIAGLLA